MKPTTEAVHGYVRQKQICALPAILRVGWKAVVKDKSKSSEAQIKRLAMSFASTPIMSHAAVEAEEPSRGSVDADGARSLESSFWGQKMIKRPVLIYLAQWSGSLAVLSAAAFVSALSGNLDLPERGRIANDRLSYVPATVDEGHAAMRCASGAGGTMGIRYVTKANPRGAVADVNPKVTCEHSSSD